MTEILVLNCLKNLLKSSVCKLMQDLRNGSRDMNCILV